MRRYAKLEEHDELRRTLGNMRQSKADEYVRTPSLGYDRGLIPMYYGT